MTFETSAEVTVSFTAEAVRISSNLAVVRIQVLQTLPDEESEIPINDGYCMVEILEGETLTDISTRVARNPFTKAFQTAWQDDHADAEKYHNLGISYDTAVAAHDDGPDEGWETVHSYQEGLRRVQVQVAETHGAWYYRTQGAQEDGIYDDPHPTREAAIAAATGVE